MKNIILSIAAIALISCSTNASAITLQPTSQSSYKAAIINGAVRYRALSPDKENKGQHEVYIGQKLGEAKYQDQYNRLHLDWNNSNNFSISYNSITGVLLSTVNNISVSKVIDSNLSISKFGILLRGDDKQNQTVSLTNLLLNGESLSDMSASSETLYFLNDNLNFTNGLTLSGTLNIVNDSQNEHGKVEFGFSGTPVPEPTSIALSAMGILGLLGVRKK